MLDIVFSYGWEPVPIHRIRMNTRNYIKLTKKHGKIIMVITLVVRYDLESVATL